MAVVDGGRAARQPPAGVGGGGGGGGRPSGKKEVRVRKGGVGGGGGRWAVGTAAGQPPAALVEEAAGVVAGLPAGKKREAARVVGKKMLMSLGESSDGAGRAERSWKHLSFEELERISPVVRLPPMPDDVIWPPFLGISSQERGGGGLHPGNSSVQLDELGVHRIQQSSPTEQALYTALCLLMSGNTSSSVFFSLYFPGDFLRGKSMSIYGFLAIRDDVGYLCDYVFS